VHLARVSRLLTITYLAVLGALLSSGLIRAQAPAADTFKTNYFSNANSGYPSQTVYVSNPGTSGGNICALIYVFDQSQELRECCGCPISADGLLTLSVDSNLTSNPATPAPLTRGTIDIVASKGGNCNPATGFSPTPSIRAWATHIQAPVGSGPYLTEADFQNATLSSYEEGLLRSKCEGILANESGYGVCTCSTPPAITSCLPTSSLTTLVQRTNVVAYVPNGSWDSGVTGVQVVPIEPATGAPTAIATPNPVNSCSSNPVTGETVCTANNTDVYLITGTTLNATLTSGSNGFAGFSGGRCQNCGVAINGVTNTAVITVGLGASPSGSGIQFLNLASNTFSPPVPATNEVSEDILWDPGRDLILSPNEFGFYDLFQTSSSSATPEFGNPVGGELDSAAEDCLTGIALATDEFTSNLFITDLTQAKLTPGSPGSWTAPSMFLNIPDFNPYVGSEAGTDGIAVAPGSHLGIVTGEFPSPASQGNAIIAVQLPSTSGSGTPAFVDWVVAVLPNDPDGNPFSMGCDPHTVTAYVSPNTGAAMGVLTDYGATPCYAGGTPSYLGLINLQALLSAPRQSGTHTATNPLPTGVVTFVSVH